MHDTLRPSARLAAAARRRLITRAALEACEPRRLLAVSTITGTVFSDANKDGLKNGADAGLANYTVYADLNYNSVKDGSDVSATTDANGFYTLGVPLQDGKRSLAVQLLNVPTSQITAPPGGMHTGKYNVVLTAGNRNFGVATATQPTNATVTGRVVNDVNRNGTADAGEGGLEGVSVYADYDGDGVLDQGEPVAFTTSTGGYTLTTTRSTFAVRVITANLADVAAGKGLFLQTGSRTVNASAGGAVNGGDVTAVTAGYVRVAPQTAELNAEAYFYFFFANSNFSAWLDANGNGIREATEPLAAYFGPNPFPAFSGTDAEVTGNFAVAVPTGAASQIAISASSAVGATALGKIAASAAASATPMNVMGITVPTTQTAVFGRIFTDANRNGVIDGADATLYSPDAEQLTVYADYNNNGTPDAGEPSVSDFWNEQSTRMSYDGYFYLPVTAGKAFSLRVADRNFKYVPTVIPQYTVAAGKTIANANLGITASAKVTGRVTIDANRNGVADAGEVGTEQFQVFADYDGDGVIDLGEPVANALNADGTYSLRTEYRSLVNVIVRPTSPDFEVTGPSGRGVTTNSGAAANVDFSIARKATTGPVSTITGTVFGDTDKDGVRDAGELGLANYTVYADLNYNGVKDGNDVSATTDANGFYTLAVPLQDGKRSLAVQLQNVPYSQVTAPPGGAHTGKFNVVLTAGNRNFGVITNVPTPTSYVVSGSVYKDVDRDGVDDAGEGNLADVRVYADYNGNGVYDPDENEPSTVAGSNGLFELTVKPGATELRVANLALPSVYSFATRGFVQTSAAGAAIARVDTSNAATLSGRRLGAVGASVVTVQPRIDLAPVPNAAGITPGQAAELAFRFAGPYTGWRDLDFDGVRDSNESSEQYFYKLYPDGDGYLAYSFVIADGESFQVGVSRNGAVGAAAEAIVNATGGPGTKDYSAVIAANQTAIVGRLFDDNDSDGKLDAVANPTFWFTSDSKRVFADYDYDGVRDTDEPSAAGIGAYTFEESSLLGYFVLYVDPNRPFKLTLDNGGGKASLYQSPAAPSTKVAANTFQGLYDVGQSYDVGVVSGLLRNDVNRDGVVQSNEGGLAGARVFVDYDGDGFRDANEPSALTDGGGYYAITAKQGTYKVWIDQPTRYERNFANNVGNGPNGEAVGTLVYQTGAAGRSPQTATIVAGAQRGGFNFTGVAGGYAVVAARTPEVDANVKDTFGVGGGSYSWYDVDGDNVRDANEPGTTKDNAGLSYGFGPNFLFDTVIVPAGVASKIGFAPTNAVGAVATASTTVTVAANETPANPKEVVVPNTEAGVFGTLFLDANNNGVRDGNESVYGVSPSQGARIFADYNNDGVQNNGEPSTIPYDSELSRDFGSSYFYLPVQANRSFTLRLKFDGTSNYTQSTGDIYSVGTNLISTGATVGVRLKP